MASPKQHKKSTQQKPSAESNVRNLAWFTEVPSQVDQTQLITFAALQMSHTILQRAIWYMAGHTLKDGFFTWKKWKMTRHFFKSFSYKKSSSLAESFLCYWEEKLKQKVLFDKTFSVFVRSCTITSTQGVQASILLPSPSCRVGVKQHPAQTHFHVRYYYTSTRDV